MLVSKVVWSSAYHLLFEQSSPSGERTEEERRESGVLVRFQRQQHML